MEYSNLSNLISALEYGTNLHISIVFLNRYGNEKTRLPKEQKIHTCPICDMAKTTPEGFAACFRCRNTALKWCIRHKRSFGGFCVKGVYEYCRPVVRDSVVLAVIFIGNILTDSERQHFILRKHVKTSLLKTMQINFTEDDCVCTADVLESYIMFLLDKYGEISQEPTDALIENIKNYITENLLYDFSMLDLSAVFNYNEKYLGRLFKSKVGCTIKEYCHAHKIEEAKNLLKTSNFSITDISILSGFNNVSYFNRIFKRITGISPRQYRTKKHIENHITL